MMWAVGKGVETLQKCEKREHMSGLYSRNRRSQLDTNSPDRLHAHAEIRGIEYKV